MVSFLRGSVPSSLRRDFRKWSQTKSPATRFVGGLNKREKRSLARARALSFPKKKNMLSIEKGGGVPRSLGGKTWVWKEPRRCGSRGRVFVERVDAQQERRRRVEDRQAVLRDHAVARRPPGAVHGATRGLLHSEVLASAGAANQPQRHFRRARVVLPREGLTRGETLL